MGQRTGRLAGSLFEKSELQISSTLAETLGVAPASRVSTSPPNDPGALWRLTDCAKMQAYGARELYCHVTCTGGKVPAPLLMGV